MTGARVVRAAGALVEAAPLPRAALYEIVRVGQRRLLGEVIRVQGEIATVQVFEDTTGLALGEPVVATGAPLQAELGPGLLGSVLDGTGRPLSRLAEQEGQLPLHWHRRTDPRPVAPVGFDPLRSRRRTCSSQATNSARWRRTRA